MKNRIFNSLLFLAVMALATGCPRTPIEGPQEPIIDPVDMGGTILNMPSGGTFTLKMVDFTDEAKVMATAGVGANGSFTFTLPVFAERDMKSAADIFKGQSIIPTISAPEVKAAVMKLVIFKDGVKVGAVTFGTKSTESEEYQATAMFYANGVCKVSGSTTGDPNRKGIDIDAVKGMNWAFEKRTINDASTEEYLLTTTAPSTLGYYYPETNKGPELVLPRTFKVEGTIKGRPEAGEVALKLVDGSKAAGEVIMQCSVALDGAFSLQLPGSFAPGELHPFAKHFEGFPERAFHLSNPTARFGDATMKLYVDGVPAGLLTYGKYTEQQTSVPVLRVDDGWLFWADRDCKVTSDPMESQGCVNTFDLDLKKGWNWIFESHEESSRGSTTKYTTEVPAGAEFMWPDFGGSSTAEASALRLSGKIANLPAGGGGFTLEVVDTFGNSNDAIASATVAADGSFVVETADKIEIAVETIGQGLPSDGLTISNPMAKMGIVQVAVKKDGVMAGSLFHGLMPTQVPPSAYHAEYYLWVDVDCNVTGTGMMDDDEPGEGGADDNEVGVVFELTLKGGQWNSIYTEVKLQGEELSRKMTTVPPVGALQYFLFDENLQPFAPGGEVMRMAKGGIRRR